jgi:hypothetical protein
MMERGRVTGYFCSLPERSLRALSALAGGAVHELGDLALPPRVRRSRLYQSLVASTARFLTEDIAQMESRDAGGEPLPENFLTRRAAGNLLEMTGIVAFRASPVWVLAALADLAGAGRQLIPEIAKALQQDGLLEAGGTFENLDQLLDGLERTAGRLAEAVNTPPLDVAGLREEWRQLRAEAAPIPRAVWLPTAGQLSKQWAALQQEAAAQERSVLALSSAMALTAVRKLPERARWLSSAVRTAGSRTGAMLGEALLDHYRTELAEIRAAGYFRYWLREARPYLVAAARQFAPARTSATERLLARRRDRTDLQ